jgi:curved DNA-binding protein CbpA
VSPLDPYALLGLPRDATTAQVRTAYRRLAKKAHPDVGGDAEVFDRIKLAHDVLTDEARRAKYDATGAIDPTAVDNSHVALMGMLSNALDAALQEIAKTGGVQAVARTDLIKVMFKHIRAQREHLDKHRAGLIDSRPNWAALAERITAKPGRPNRLGEIVLSRMVAIDTQLAAMTATEKTVDAAILALGDYDFRVDPPPPPEPITMQIWPRFTSPATR